MLFIMLLTTSKECVPSVGLHDLKKIELRFLSLLDYLFMPSKMRRTDLDTRLSSSHYILYDSNREEWCHLFDN